MISSSELFTNTGQFVPGGGGGGGDSHMKQTLEMLNLTSKGDHLGVAEANFDA